MVNEEFSKGIKSLRTISQRDHFPYILYFGSSHERIKTQINMADLILNMIKKGYKSALTLFYEKYRSLNYCSGLFKDILSFYPLPVKYHVRKYNVKPLLNVQLDLKIKL